MGDHLHEGHKGYQGHKGSDRTWIRAMAFMMLAATVGLAARPGHVDRTMERTDMRKGPVPSGLNLRVLRVLRGETGSAAPDLTARWVSRVPNGDFAKPSSS